MTHSKKLFAFLLTIVMLVCILPMQVFAAKENGWEKQGDYWYYYENGVAVKNDWRKSGGKWYYFGSNGSMWANTYVIGIKDGKYTTYVVDKSGAMVTKAGWREVKVKFSDGDYSYDFSYWFYLKKGGLAVQGWKKIDGKWYYFGKGTDSIMPGNMQKATSSVLDGKAYVFSKSGALATSTGWYKIKHAYDDETIYTWYYLKKGGIATRGWKEIGGKWYFFDKSYGYMFRGHHYIDDKLYDFDESGACLNPYD